MEMAAGREVQRRHELTSDRAKHKAPADPSNPSLVPVSSLQYPASSPTSSPSRRLIEAELQSSWKRSWACIRTRVGLHIVPGNFSWVPMQEGYPLFSASRGFRKEDVEKKKREKRKGRSGESAGVSR